jgi:hypothetical protein
MIPRATACRRVSQGGATSFTRSTRGRMTDSGSVLGPRGRERRCRTLTTPGAGGGSGEGNPNLLATTPNDPRCAVEAAGYPGERTEVTLTGSTEDSQNG